MLPIDNFDGHVENDQCALLNALKRHIAPLLALIASKALSTTMLPVSHFTRSAPSSQGYPRG